RARAEAVAAIILYSWYRRAATVIRILADVNRTETGHGTRVPIEGGHSQVSGVGVGVGGGGGGGSLSQITGLCTGHKKTTPVSGIVHSLDVGSRLEQAPVSLGTGSFCGGQP